MLKKTILSITLLTAIATHSFSQTKQAAIKDLFRLMQTDQLIDKTFDSIIPAIAQQMKSENQNDKKKSDEVLKIAMKVGKEMSQKMINHDLVALYDKHFTEQEIKRFIAFYKTPAGQKMISVLPDLQKEMMTIMMMDYMPKMRNKMMDAVKSYRG